MREYTFFKETFKSNGLARLIRHRLYKKIIRRPDTALEFGIGHGYFRDYCKRNLIAYVGVDYASDLADEETIIAKIPEKMYCVPGGFDLILAEHFIEHMKDYETVIEFLAGCHSRLNKDGKLVLLYPNMNRHFWHDPTHQYPTNKTRIELCLSQAGFEICESRDYAHCLIGWLWVLPLRILGWFVPANRRISLHFCVHSYTIARKR